jgi:hypothetical protein
MNSGDAFTLRSAGLLGIEIALEPRHKTDFDLGLRDGVPGEIPGGIGVLKLTPIREPALVRNWGDCGGWILRLPQKGKGHAE